MGFTNGNGHNGRNRGVDNIVKVVISALASALITFLAVWFTAVEGQGNEYIADRQFILSELQRNSESVRSLQNTSSATAIQLAEIRIQLIEINRKLENLEHLEQRQPFPFPGPE